MLYNSCPSWFAGFDIAFRIIFFFITAMITFTGYHAYKFSGSQKIGCHCSGFLLISLSYLAAIVGSLGSVVGHKILNIIGLYLHAFFFLMGIIVLLLAYYDIQDKAVRGLFALFAVTIIALFNRPTEMIQDIIFYFLNMGLIGFIVAKLTTHYHNTQKITTLCVLVGFVMLLISQFFLGLAFHNSTFFVVATIISLIGYLSIGASRLAVK